MQALTLKVEQANGNEITIREGKALELRPPVKIQISGDIRTVRSFIEKRKDVDPITGKLQYISPSTTIVSVDKNNLSITLELDPENIYGTEVTGELSFTPELEQFCINKNKLFSREELIKLIRFNKIWFTEAEAHDKLLKAYQSFAATVNANIGKTSDTRGNVDNTYKKTVETNVPDSFVLNIPIFKGLDKRRFRVEIAIDSTDASTKFWFESVELKELIEIESEIILNKELESCADYVIIWK
jgi:ribosomal protein L32E